MFSLVLIMGVSAFEDKISQIEMPADSLLDGNFDVEITFSAVGDLMCHSTQFNYAKVEPDSFDFSGVYAGVRDYLKNPDFLMGNLETTFAGKKYPYVGYPIFNTPDDFLYDLKNAGFDLLFTANNHSIDKGLFGLQRTISLMKQENIHYRGTNFTPEGKDTVEIIDVKGLKTVVLAYSYGDNGMGSSKTAEYFNTIDSLKIREDIHKADSLGAELVIVYLHFGVEYQKKPNAYQKDIVTKVVDYGADIILGSHPHVMQPMMYFKAKSGRIDSGFVAYSMGNFISNQRWRYSDAGIIVNFSVIKNSVTNEIKLGNVSYLPTWVFKGSTGEKREYIIYPAELSLGEDIPQFFSDKDKWYMKESFFDTYSIVSGIDEKIQPYFLYNFTKTELDSIKLTVPESDNK